LFAECITILLNDAISLYFRVIPIFGMNRNIT